MFYKKRDNEEAYVWSFLFNSLFWRKIDRKSIVGIFLDRLMFSDLLFFKVIFVFYPYSGCCSWSKGKKQILVKQKTYFRLSGFLLDSIRAYCNPKENYLTTTSRLIITIINIPNVRDVSKILDCELKVVIKFIKLKTL